MVLFSFHKKVYEIWSNIRRSFYGFFSILWEANWIKISGVLLSMLCMFSSLAVISVLMFFGIYWFSVPKYENFDYPVHLNYSERFPSDMFSFDPSVKQSDPFHISPKFQFIPGTPTVATIDLALPESQQNRDVGIFMLTLDLLSDSNTNLLSISRPCFLQYRSSLRTTLQTLVTFPLMLVGIADETQKLSILMAPSIIPPSKKHIPKIAKITLQDRRAQIHGAKLKFNSHFSIFKNFLYHHWLLSAFTFIPILFTVFTSFVLLCILLFGIIYITLGKINSTPSTVTDTSEAPNFASVEINNESDNENEDSDDTFPPLSGENERERRYEEFTNSTRNRRTGSPNSNLRRRLPHTSVDTQ
eukprot:gb/GECH01006697.1/.p1 GENE.gb/GECH01006697.1/~~gb/GECH01006697.1/.p1  ORF type:complete len:358 (+),score=38.61 gb/GECH01006697.1/:1-1074(+)